MGGEPNRARRLQGFLPVNPGGTRWRALIRETLSAIHREWKITVASVPSPRSWVFVVGCYNSGTELLTRILGTHPEVAELPYEGQFLTDQFTPAFRLGLPRMWVLNEEQFRLTEADDGPDPIRLQKEWGIRLDRSRSIHLEKSPMNAARTRWLQRHFPNAHFILLVRNGYPVTEGIRRKATPPHLPAWPLELCARQWARSNEILREDAAYLERVLWTRYEDLTADPAGEVARILDFLDLDSQGLDLDRAWQVHERSEPIRNMNAESIARLTPGDRRVIRRVAGETLRSFGYDLL